ncbi:unnamed protein product [Protopolystoma xenopodis]|uniref:Aldehyde dehydrogenase domain-containing protein n=1 Tax=Protopolystoma xenopodis TaxID=117903 RepID=A0A3S5CJ49_9PLAT|nr:unnamed protein product [Protopolystoma xenopodis]
MHVERLISASVASGAEVRIGGNRHVSDTGKGFFFQPTVLASCTPEMPCCQEEIFGPVVPVIKFTDEAEVIHLANSTQYGLAGYMFTCDLAQAWRVSEHLQVGMLGVNTGRFSAAELPFGGIKYSGIGREGGPCALEQFMDTRSIVWH